MPRRALHVHEIGQHPAIRQEAAEGRAMIARTAPKVACRVEALYRAETVDGTEFNSGKRPPRKQEDIFTPVAEGALPTIKSVSRSPPEEEHTNGKQQAQRTELGAESLPSALLRHTGNGDAAKKTAQLENRTAEVVERLTTEQALAATASLIPQWRWTNTQCRAWLRYVLMHYSGRTEDEAAALVGEFEGWGPNLYMKDKKQWNA